MALDDCLPDALALSSPELADRMVAVTFGPVLALPAAEREELLHTTSVWIRSLGSTLRAAKSLYCHRNTVLNRLRRMESLTHLDLSDVTVWPQVLLALSILRREGRLPVEIDSV
ncbi:helix-turn-helix domain-containing protein [Saccharopolyspora gloriosae]|uniref:PucR family transcriptional regulator n=1 Tax=Saccharopolyspora gloriosae TaxID=455344 RepID=UPI001FB77CC4|nr:helix-turn-helix domain-containing protein [Saccharopolyspora gloriosae]